MPADPIDAADRAVLDHLVLEALELLDAGRLEQAALDLHEARSIAPEDPAVLGALGELAWARDDPATARTHFEAALRHDPEQADAHHALARLHEIAGEHADQVAHDLEVLRLDTARHRRAGLGGRTQVASIEAVVVDTLDRLPEPFASRLAEVPVVLEARPSPALVADGFDPRAFGLFEGPDDQGRASDELVVRPTRIVVFFANLLEANPSVRELREQVEVTLLHEIGHYFGLDEDAVEALGLG